MAGLVPAMKSFSARLGRVKPGEYPAARAAGASTEAESVRGGPSGIDGLGGSGQVASPFALTEYYQSQGYNKREVFRLLMAYFGAFQAASRVSSASGSVRSGSEYATSVSSRGSASYPAKSVLSLRSWRSASATSSVSSLLASRRDLDERFSEKEVMVQQKGKDYCYLRAVRCENVFAAADRLGPLPSVSSLSQLPEDWLEPLGVLASLRVDVDFGETVVLHVKPWGQPGKTTVKSLLLSLRDRSVGYASTLAGMPFSSADFVNGKCFVGGLPGPVPGAPRFVQPRWGSDGLAVVHGNSQSFMLSLGAGLGHIGERDGIVHVEPAKESLLIVEEPAGAVGSAVGVSINSSVESDGSRCDGGVARPTVGVWSHLGEDDKWSLLDFDGTVDFGGGEKRSGVQVLVFGKLSFRAETDAAVRVVTFVGPG